MDFFQEHDPALIWLHKIFPIRLAHLLTINFNYKPLLLILNTSPSYGFSSRAYSYITITSLNSPKF